MTETRRVKMKIGDAEFEADVPADQVQPMYDRFLATLDKRSPAATAPQGNAKPAPLAPSNEGNGAPRLPGEFDSSLLTRIFELRPDGIVTLKVLPKGESREGDAFLLLLFGYRRLKNEEHVLATHLLKSAEYSGLSVYRPAHALAAHERYVIRGGQKKGSTYALNNQGLTKAEEIATKIFE